MDQPPALPRSRPPPYGETKTNGTITNSGGKLDLLAALPTFMQRQILAFFGFKDYALTGCACKYSQAHWQLENERKPLPLYVPVDCRTLEEEVRRVKHDLRITTIVVRKGEHHICGKLFMKKMYHVLRHPARRI